MRVIKINDATAKIVAQVLAEAFDLRGIVDLLLTMGLRYSDLALALNVHPNTVRAWMDEEECDLSQQRDGILSLKALILFLLRRGVITPSQVVIWLVEPLPELAFRRPLAVLAKGRTDSLNEVINANRGLIRPENVVDQTSLNPSVAAGAAGRGVVATHK